MGRSPRAYKEFQLSNIPVSIAIYFPRLPLRGPVPPEVSLGPDPPAVL